MLKKIKDRTDLAGKKVLLRLDLNVPIKDGKVADDYRIKRILPTLAWLRDQGVKTMIISHIEGKGEANLSLKPVYEYLLEHFALSFAPDFFSPETADLLSKIQDGEIVLFENVRNDPGEKTNDPEFARKLGKLGDIYVNDAFAVSHRAHASIVGLPKIMPSYMGPLLAEEVENLNGLGFESPFLFVLGGAKFDTKLPLIQKFLEKADHVFIGGALANDLYKAKGFPVGKSLVADKPLDLSAIAANPKTAWPDDVVVKCGEVVSNKMPEEVSADDIIMDAGVKAMITLQNLISNAKSILWNGPLGNYEQGFKEPTLDLARMIAERTGKKEDGSSDVKSVLGGGDTLAAIKEADIENKFTFVSTGGGAMLEFLLNDTLVGIKALEESVVE
jgi:phosphoglycerate kinase